MISISIVLYKQNSIDLEAILTSISKITIEYKLFIIDNSPNNTLKDLFNDNKIIYTNNNKNVGFGAGHNIAINKSLEIDSKYHIVMNPDIYFDAGVIERLIEYIDSHQDTGLIMPEILYPNGQIQYLPKLLPGPLDLVIRRFFYTNNLFKNRINSYEMRSEQTKKSYESPIISGCFSIFRTEVFYKIGLYDERFFMYFEDFDISRRVNQKYKTVYYPLVSVYHNYERGAGKRIMLFQIFIMSAIRYFNKWGWVFDFSRKQVNAQAIQKFKEVIK